MRGKPVAATGEAEPIRGRRAHGHASSLHTERPGEPFAHLVAHVSDPWLLRHEDAVGVHELEAAAVADLAIGLPEQIEEDAPRYCSSPDGKSEPMSPRFAAPRSASMHGRSRRRRSAPRGRAGSRSRRRRGRAAHLERVRVEAEPHPELAHASEARLRERREVVEPSAAGPARRRPHGPRRIWTATSPAAAAGRTSLSTRSPTYAVSSGRQPASSTTRQRNAGRASAHRSSRTRR